MPVQIRSSPQNGKGQFLGAGPFLYNQNYSKNSERVYHLSDEIAPPKATRANWWLPPFPVLETMEMSEEITWKKINNYIAVTRCGGYPFPNPEYSGDPLKHWPHFDGKPLPFFAQVVLSPTRLALVFLDDSVDGSWHAENGANAVLISDSQVFPRWVDIKPLGPNTPDDISMRFRNKEESRCPAWTPSAVPSIPNWLQADEQPENSRLVLEIPSGLDGSGVVDIGNRNGTVYVFVSNDNKRGWVIWQSKQ